jgi:hypothetical protein
LLVERNLMEHTMIDGFPEVILVGGGKSRKSKKTKKSKKSRKHSSRKS